MKQLIFTAITVLCLTGISYGQTCEQSDTLNLFEGETLYLDAAYTWNYPLTFKWHKDGVPLSDTDSIFTINDLQLADAGYYQCEIKCASWPAPIYFCYTINVQEAGDYALEELIIDFDKLANPQQMRAQLIAGGMVFKDGCLCGGLELWEVNPNDPLLDIEETVKKASATLDEEESGTNAPNYEFAVPDPQVCLEDEQVEWEALVDVVGQPTTPVVVAVVDNGFDENFPGVLGNTWVNSPVNPDPIACCNNMVTNGYNAVNACASINPRKHGTAVASIIGQYSPSNVPLEMMNIKVKRSKKKGNLFKFACGLRYAIDSGADIINISMGYYGKESALLKHELQRAKDNDILVVTSAGNGGERRNNHWPSCFSKDFDNVIAVGAVDQNGSQMDFSSDGDIYAPGHNLHFHNPATGQKFVKSGTSFSAAFVTGAAVSIVAQNPSIKPKDIINELMFNGWSSQGTNLNVAFTPTSNPVPASNDLWISYPLYGEEEFVANNTIRASSLVYASATVTMKAGQEVRFTHGFYAEDGSDLRAFIGTCDAPQLPQRQLIEEEIVIADEVLMLEEEEVLVQVENDIKIKAVQDHNKASFLVYPNPFTTQTTLRFVLEEEAEVQLQIRNALGQTIKVLENKHKTGGVHSYRFSAEALPSGMYFATLQVGDDVFVEKMVLR